jgi:hypothetical protein
MAARVQNIPVSLKVAPLLKAASFAGGMTFFIGEFIGDRTLDVAAIGLVSAVLAAFFAALPGLLREVNSRRARSEDRESAFLRERINYAAQQLVLVRASKHNALAHVQELQAHIGKLRALMSVAKIEPPLFEFKYYDDLCGEEDRVLAQLALPDGIHTSVTQERRER